MGAEHGTTDDVGAVTPDPPRFDRSSVLLMSVAHFAHDCYPAFLGVMLPLLIDDLGISLTVAGFLASGLRWTTSVQPFLGHLADRTDTRYWVILAPAVTATSMSLVGIAPTATAAFALLLLTGLSHAAFHPAGGALATRASGNEWGKGTSWFMTGGELGRVVGPIVIAAILGLGGLRLSPIAVVPGLIMSLVLYRRLHAAPTLHTAGSAPARLREAIAAGRRPLAVLGIAMFLRAMANIAIVVFYPTYATGAGASLVVAGLAITLYEAGAVVGAFGGGILSDRHGRSRLMLAGLLLGGPALIGAVLLGPVPLGLALLVLGGLGWLSANSIELVTMQELLPGNRATAVGLTYFIKAAGSIVATLGLGVVGDRLGLRTAIVGAVVVGLAAAPFLIAVTDPERASAR